MQVQFERRVNYATEQPLHFKLPALLPARHFASGQPGGGGSVKRRERRIEPRLAHSFPARVWGVDIDHEAFGLDCVLDDISPSGLYLRVPWRIKSQSQISLVVHLLSGPNDGTTVAIKGRVIRDEPETDGKRGIAVMITEVCFL